MNNIFLKYLGIFFLFYNQVCVITKKVYPEDAKKKCLRSTRVTKTEAEDLIVRPMYPATTEYQRCFLQCYFTYSNKIVIASIKEPQSSDLLAAEVFIVNKTPASVAICIEEKKSSAIGGKCMLGGYTRQCHIDFAKEVAEALHLEIVGVKNKQLEYTATEVISTTTEGISTSTESISTTTEGIGKATEGNTTVRGVY